MEANAVGSLLELGRFTFVSGGKDLDLGRVLDIYCYFRAAKNRM